ncbi:MAG: glycosyltransferase family 9 protein [Planctomycetota bacterium]
MHESPCPHPVAAPLPDALKPYVVLETEAADVGPGSRLAGWWVLTWRARLPVLQLGRGRSRPVPRAVLHAADDDPDAVRAALADATLLITTERAHLMAAAELDLPTVFVADGRAPLVLGQGASAHGLPPEAEAFVPGSLAVVGSDTAWRRDLPLRRVFEACERMAPGLFPASHGESALCRERVLPYLRGRVADLGHGGCKILPEAVGVDFFRHDEHDWIADVRDLWFAADGCFDAVFSSHCLEDLWHPRQALDEWGRVLAPGGHLCLYLPLRDHYPNVGTEGANPGHKDDYVPEDVEGFLADVGGFDVVLSERREAEDSFEVIARRRPAPTVVPVPTARPRLSVLVDGPCSDDPELDARALLASLEALRAGLAGLPTEVLVRQRSAPSGDALAALRDLAAADRSISLVEDRGPAPLPARLSDLAARARADRVLVLSGDALFLGDGARRLLEAAEREGAALAWPVTVDLDGAPVAHEVPACALVHRDLLEGIADRPYHTLLCLRALEREARRGGGRVVTAPEALLLAPGPADRPVQVRRHAPRHFDRALLARGPREPGRREEVLLFVLRTFGDCLLATPVVQALRDRRPEARLTVACEEAYAWGLRRRPAGRRRRRPRGRLLGHLLQREDHALCRVLDEGPECDRLILLSDRADAVAYHHSGRALPAFYAEQAALPEAADLAPQVVLPARLRAEVEAVLAAEGIAPGTPYATLHASSGWRLKDPGAEACRHLVGELRERHGLAVVQLGAAGEGLEAVPGPAAAPPFVDLCGRLSMQQSAAVVAGARAHVGPDSAPLHLASCFDVPSLALYAGSGVRVAPPTSPRSVAVQSPASCAVPCGVSRCHEHRPCAEALAPRDLAAALDALLVGPLDRVELSGREVARYVAGPDGPVLLPTADDARPTPSPVLPQPALPRRQATPAPRPVPARTTLRPGPLPADWTELCAPTPHAPATDDDGRRLVAGLELLLTRLAPWSAVALLRRLADLATVRLTLDEALRLTAVALGRAAAIERGLIGRRRPAFRILVEEVLRDGLARIHGLSGSLDTAARLCDLAAEESRADVPLALLAAVVAAAPRGDACPAAALLARLDGIDVDSASHAELLALTRAWLRLGRRDRAVAALEQRLATLGAGEARTRLAMALELGLALGEDPARTEESLAWLAEVERGTEDEDLRRGLGRLLRPGSRRPPARVLRLPDVEALAAHHGLPRRGRVLEPDVDEEHNECEAGGRKRRDAEVLCLLAANAEGDVLDLGTSHGRSAFKLATNVPPPARVFTVNALPGQLGDDEVHVTHRLPIHAIGEHHRAQGCTNVVQLFANTRHWRPPATVRDLGLVFVDASHDEEAVLSDSRLAWSLLRPGGFLAWHDFCPDRRATWAWIDAVMRGVERFVAGLEAPAELGWVEGSWIAVLRKPGGGAVPTRITDPGGQP